jgi:hypothetical protein
MYPYVNTMDVSNRAYFHQENQEEFIIVIILFFFFFFYSPTIESNLSKISVLVDFIGYQMFYLTSRVHSI